MISFLPTQLLTRWSLHLLLASISGQALAKTLSYRDGSLRGDIVLYNGTIHTQDAAGTIASVVAIKDGKFVYVGDSVEEAGQAIGDIVTPTGIDLQGRVTIPGLVDCHNHLVLLGNRPGYHTPLENANSIAAVQETLSQRAANVPNGSFITTIGGFNRNQFTELRLPTLEELDAAVPDHPVFISQSFLGPATTNTLGRAFLETSSQAVTVAANGSITQGDETGKSLLALRAPEQLTMADRRRGVRDAMTYAVQVGVTTHLDQGAFPATGTPTDGAAHEDLYAMHKPWLDAFDAEEGIVRLRINFLHMDAVPGVPTVQQRLLNTFSFFGNDMIRTGSIGEFIAANYTGGPVFEEAATLIARAGWRMEVHSLDASDFQTQIQSIENVHAAEGDASMIPSLRWVIAHVPRITVEYLQRLKALGGGVNLSGWNYLSGTGTSAGPPFRTIVDSGIPAGIGADGMQIAPLNPWLHAYYAITGKNAKGELVNAGQQITREEVLTMYTRSNQWFLGGPDEALLGAIEVGRLGDVVVLSDDYFSVPEEDIKKLTSVLTVVGGTVVHDSGLLSG